MSNHQTSLERNMPGVETGRPDTNTNANSVNVASQNLEHSFDIDRWVTTKIFTATTGT